MGFPEPRLLWAWFAANGDVSKKDGEGQNKSSLYLFLSGTVIDNDLQSEIRFEIFVIKLLANLCRHDPNVV